MQETESDDGDYQNNEGLFSFRETAGGAAGVGVPLDHHHHHHGKDATVPSSANVLITDLSSSNNAIGVTSRQNSNNYYLFGKSSNRGRIPMINKHQSNGNGTASLPPKALPNDHAAGGGGANGMNEAERKNQIALFLGSIESS
jgi:hypothetical protein